MSDCIFCKIVQGEIPCAKIYEDDHVLSFLDINPINPGHALVIPKVHYATLFDMPEPVLEACTRIAQRVGRAIQRSLQPAGLNFLQNNFEAAGQLIDHAHFHLIPRRAGDGFLQSWPGGSYAAGDMAKILEEVTAAL